MRISSQMLFMRDTNSLMDKQSKLSDQNVHLSSQKRVIHGSDDPVAIATIQRLKQDLSIGEQFIENGQVAESANEQTNTALTQSTYILQRVRELMVSGSNDTMNESNREAIAIELESLRDELIGVANTKDGHSQYIFSGFEVGTEPFQKNEFGQVTYQGDRGERNYRIGSGVSVRGNESGASVFMDIAEGNGSFVSELGARNQGGGVISEGSIIDPNAARDFLKQDYTIAVSTETDLTGNDIAEYSVYGLEKDSGVTGSANIKINSIDLADANITSVAPNTAFPATGSDVNIKFTQIGTSKQFEVSVNGKLSADVYDANNMKTQEIKINGISLEVDGLPEDGDSYNLTKFVAATPYQENQAITFNGIKTQLKGELVANDTFTLRQSEEKDVFSTMQSSIDALRIIGTDNSSTAARNNALSNSLLQVDGALDNVTNTLSSVGARLRTIENQNESTLDFNLTVQSTLSNLEDLDMTAAISDFQQQHSMLEVSQQTFVKLQQLSLFSLI